MSEDGDMHRQPPRKPRDADKMIRGATAAVVTAVAAVAAVVSYTHIYDVARHHGQSGLAATLLPLSVDGLILAASLVLLHEARNKRAAPALARWMLAFGVGATVAANVGYGLPFGMVGAVVSAWPAVAFIGSVELMMVVVSRARQDAAAAVAPAAALAPRPATSDAPPGATAPPASAPRKAAPKVTSRATPGTAGAQQKARQIRGTDPGITQADLARRVGVSKRTLQRWESDTGGDTAGDIQLGPEGDMSPLSPQSSVVDGPWARGTLTTSAEATP
jgi:hypothetical protein